VDANHLPSLFYKFWSKCSKVSMAKDTSKIPFLDSSLMAIVPVTNLIGKLLLELHKAHHIQPLENMGTMCWVSNELNVELLSLPKELEGEV
jgi:hypothetical protein